MGAINYTVRKTTVKKKYCAVCKGSGLVSINKKCPHCVEGITTFEEITETPLLEALKDLGLIK